MAVVFAAFGKGAVIGLVAGGVEGLGVLAVAGDTVAFEVGEVARQGRGPEASALVAHHPRLDGDAPRRAGAKSERARTAPAEAATARSRATAPETLGGMARLLGAFITCRPRFCGGCGLGRIRRSSSRRVMAIPANCRGGVARGLECLAQFESGDGGWGYPDAGNCQLPQPSAPNRRRAFILPSASCGVERLSVPWMDRRKP